MNSNGLFITATDTGAGKTYVGTSLCKTLFRNDFIATPRKPIESGCDASDYGLIANDANAWYQACNQTTRIEHICKYAFEQAIAPDEAARQSGTPIYLSELLEACEDEQDRFTLVEGAGGFYTPLCEDGLNADLAVALGHPLIVVVEDRLGAINQALLTIAAVEQQALTITALVLNAPPGNNRQTALIADNEIDPYKNHAGLLSRQPYRLLNTSDDQWRNRLMELIEKNVGKSGGQS